MNQRYLTFLFKKRFALVVVFVSLFSCLGLVILAIATEPPTKSEWLRRKSAELQELKVTKNMVDTAPKWKKFPYGSAWSYNLSKPAIIPVGNDEWVYVVFHSWHDLERSNHFFTALYSCLFANGRKRIHVGDAILAIDSHGRLFVNDGHVCGLLQLFSEQPIRSMNDFLKYTYEFSPENRWRPFARH